MKNLLRVLLAGACFPTLLAAANSLVLGGGLNLSSTSGDANGVEYSKRVGYNLGIGYESELSPMLSVLPEFNLETRGDASKMEDTPFGEIEGHLNLLYLQVPVFLMLKAPLPWITLNAYAGPAIGILLSAKSGIEINGEEETLNIQDEMKPFDVGIEMGLGFEVPMADVNFFVRPSYYLGLMNVEDSAEEDGFRLRNIRLKAGFGFPL
jgi:hypothetical protein